MVSPEGNPKNQTPNIPENKPPEPKGFQVRIENSDLIFKAIQAKRNGELGNQLLESPIKEVDVDLKTTKDTFNLTGAIHLDFNKTRDKSIDVQETKRRIAQRFLENTPNNKITERGGHFIVIASRGTKFIISGHLIDDKIDISTGIIRDFLEDKQVLTLPSSNQENYDTVMADFIDILEASVEEIYRSIGKTAPSEEMVLRPPKIKNNSEDRRTNSDEFKTPDDLLGKIEIEKPDMTFDEVGGQEKAKIEVQGLAFALKNPDLYKKWGTKPPKGIILYGPPGTGKTLMAKALASEAEARFFRIEASDIASKWYGESEKLLKEIFSLANNPEEKTILFFDEIDAITPEREGSHEATHRIVSTFLENMDGITSSTDNNIMIVASTNRLNSIDPALLRAGRFDRWVEVPLPDENGRKQIFSIHMEKAKAIAGRDLFDEIDMEKIISTTDKASGADIAEIIRRTLEEKVRQEGTGINTEKVTTEDILKQIKNYEKIREAKKTIGFNTTPQIQEKLSSNN
jgi:AAA+ superfamily predicted ATPase